MMRSSGVSPLVNFSKLAREMLRLAASGHMPSMQDSKLAAASRIAEACISGWPEEPDSPDHSFGGAGGGAVGALGGGIACVVTATGAGLPPTGIGGTSR